MKFIDAFLFISTHIMLGLVSLGSAGADDGSGRNLNNDLIASCVRNICAKKLLKSANLSLSYNR